MYPIINRGTWARVQAYRQVIENFVNTFVQGKKQPVNILSLGAGFDTTPFWLHEKLLKVDEQISRQVCYIEVDWEKVVTAKISVIAQKPELAKLIAVPKDAD